MLSGCDEISDEGMRHLAQLAKLTSLNMSNCCKVSRHPGMSHPEECRASCFTDKDRWQLACTESQHIRVLHMLTREGATEAVLCRCSSQILGC